MKAHTKETAGFTLIELSIVLVIIGLLAAGILTGQALIEGAQIRATVEQFTKYSTAANTFKTKFNCLPGDCAQAESLGLGAAGAPGHNGDGNGIVGTIAGADAWESDEGPNFWFHLYGANLIPDVVSGSFGDNAFAAADPGPFLRYATTNEVTGKRPRIWVIAGSLLNIAVNYGAYEYHNPVLPHSYFLIPPQSAFIANGAGSFLPMQLYQIDSKMDDGFPKTGIMAAAGGTINPPASLQPASQFDTLPPPPNARWSCVDATVSPNIYNIGLNRDKRDCSAIIKATF